VTYRVQVRVKGAKNLSQSFDDYETAYIWGKYKEMILKEKAAFAPEPEHMYTLLDVMVAKYGYGSREMNDCEPYFKPYWHTYMSKLTYDVLMEHAKLLLKTKIRKGGNVKNNKGVLKLPQPMTILRKFAYLSAAVNEMIKKGVPLENHALKVVAYLRELDKKEKNGSS